MSDPLLDQELQLLQDEVDNLKTILRATEDERDAAREARDGLYNALDEINNIARRNL